ncbi:MAG: hypothetical protein NC238_05055 [Dehalobacter sp.]|nr:hypothetical protein [Dehalobacter sp.]
MIGALKLKGEEHCQIQIPKAVFSYWPYFDRYYLNALVANICLTFQVLPNSEIPMTGAYLCFKRGHIHKGHLKNISATLLDCNNPLTTSYTGLYLPSDDCRMLLKYDGVDNVIVDDLATFSLHPSTHIPVEFIKISLSSPVYPGFCVAVRFIYICKNMFDVARDNSIHFTNTFFDERTLTQVFGIDHLLKRQIPFWTTYDSQMNGGFDIFYYMPLELQGECFETDPISRLRLRYDYLGRTTEFPFKKYSWRAKNLLRLMDNTPKSFGIGDPLVITGVFSHREQKGSAVYIINRDGLMIVGNTITNSDIENKWGGEEESTKKLDALCKYLEQLDDELKKNRSLNTEQAALIKSFTDSLKVQKTSRNPKLLSLSVEGLLEATKTVRTIAPSVSDIVDNIKALFF